MIKSRPPLKPIRLQDLMNSTGSRHWEKNNYVCCIRQLFTFPSMVFGKTEYSEAVNASWVLVKPVTVKHPWRIKLVKPVTAMSVTHTWRFRDGFVTNLGYRRLILWLSLVFNGNPWLTDNPWRIWVKFALIKKRSFYWSSRALPRSCELLVSSPL